MIGFSLRFRYQEMELDAAIGKVADEVKLIGDSAFLAELPDIIPDREDEDLFQSALCHVPHILFLSSSSL